MHGSVHPLNICLYTIIPEWEEGRRYPRPWRQRFKSIIRHGLNRLATALSRRLFLNIYHYENVHGLGENSNKGDISIRMAIKQQLVNAFAPRPVNFTEVKWGTLSDEVAEVVNRTCDIFVIAGGGYMFLRGDGSPGGMLAKVEELDKIRCPVFAYGIGLNRVKNEKVRDLRDLPDATREKIRYLADKCELIGVRDFETVQLFKLHSDKSAILTGDPALFYQSQRLSFASQTPRPLTIGINLASHGRQVLPLLTSLLPNIITLLKKIQRSYYVEFVYLQHHDLERPVVDYLRAQGVRLRLVSGSPADLVEEYAKLDFVINQMLHSCILSANAGTPFLNIAYDEKNVAFCNLMGVPQCCVPHDSATLTVLEQRFFALFEQQAQLRDMLDRGKTELRGSLTHFAKHIVNETEERFFKPAQIRMVTKTPGTARPARLLEPRRARLAG
jgi:polysaccharide pyruvyl transferase WcaK-like protein